MPDHYTDEQKANRKKGGMAVQNEQLEKYRKRAKERARRRSWQDKLHSPPPHNDESK